MREIKTIEDIIENIKGRMFMFEHQPVGESNLVFCETCREAVEKGSPCKESRYYLVWQELNDLLKTIQ